jgi:hypothetical protein
VVLYVTGNENDPDDLAEGEDRDEDPAGSQDHGEVALPRGGRRVQGHGIFCPAGDPPAHHARAGSLARARSLGSRRGRTACGKLERPRRPSPGRPGLRRARLRHQGERARLVDHEVVTPSGTSPENSRAKRGGETAPLARASGTHASVTSPHYLDVNDIRSPSRMPLMSDSAPSSFTTTNVTLVKAI